MEKQPDVSPSHVYMRTWSNQIHICVCGDFHPSIHPSVCHSIDSFIWVSSHISRPFSSRSNTFCFHEMAPVWIVNLCVDFSHRTESALDQFSVFRKTSENGSAACAAFTRQHDVFSDVRCFFLLMHPTWLERSCTVRLDQLISSH